MMISDCIESIESCLRQDCKFDYCLHAEICMKTTPAINNSQGRCFVILTKMLKKLAAGPKVFKKLTIHAAARN